MHDASHSLHKTPRLQLPIAVAGAYAAPQGKHFPPHKHVTWELVYYRSGCIPCPVGDEKYESRPGMLLLTPPQVFHAEYATEAYSNFFIAIDAPALHPWPRVYQDDSYHTFGNLFSTIVREWEGKESDREEMLALLTDQLDILLRRTQEQQHISEAERLVREAEHLMAERYNTSLTIKEVASEVGVSPSYLRIQFARLRGHSPMAHLQSIRLQHALTILRNSNASLETVATICGYDSASHLSRYVKRATGKSPGTMRPDKLD